MLDPLSELLQYTGKNRLKSKKMKRRFKKQKTFSLQIRYIHS